METEIMQTSREIMDAFAFLKWMAVTGIVSAVLATIATKHF